LKALYSAKKMNLLKTAYLPVVPAALYVGTNIEQLEVVNAPAHAFLLRAQNIG
jgi:hypothetical protein